METEQDHATAKGTNYGAAAWSLVIGGPWSVHRAASPVLANVDLPFRPLAAFVPESHWRRLERSGPANWHLRLGHAVAALRALLAGR